MTSSSEMYPVQPLSYSNTKYNTPTSTSSNSNRNEQNLQVVSNLSIENSEDVYFGDKNIYQGPVVLEKIIYKNGKPYKIKKQQVKHGIVENAQEKDNRQNGETKIDSFYQTDSGGDIINRGKPPASFVDNKTEVQRSNNKSCTPLYHIVKNHPIRSSMIVSIVVFSLLLISILLIKYLGKDFEIRIIPRLEWGAQPQTNDTTPLVTPVPYVIMHHTASESCSSLIECIQHVRFIQDFHQQSRGFYDIGYNFLIGGDGNIYMGRGWTVEGAHAFGYNARSIGIAVIGTYTNIKPPDHVITTCKKLIEMGVQLGYIKNDYKLLTARQLSGTESPGVQFFNDIKTWSHWAKEP